MGRFDISPEVAEEWRGKFRESVKPLVGEEVLAVGTFRTTGAGTKYAISKTQGRPARASFSPHPHLAWVEPRA